MSLSYLFWPNPQATSYDSPKVVAILVACAAMVALSFAVRSWRVRQTNPVTKRLSRGWSAALLLFAGFALVFVVARVEGISFVSMRVWWIVWAVALVFVLLAQVRRWRAMHYEVLPSSSIHDPREKYLPKKKKH
ncbi:hypothetical protein FJZ27_03975 [Candidatus Peribacteria bacterium]|nr:hypothetical protein [Candidatus Peribacteria bacterium]